jgi:hypothetical protein
LYGSYYGWARDESMLETPVETTFSLDDILGEQAQSAWFAAFSLPFG